MNLNKSTNNFNFQLDKNSNIQSCLHDRCTDCKGTGKKENGSSCFHYLSCPCKKCNPYYL